MVNTKPGTNLIIDRIGPYKISTDKYYIIDKKSKLPVEKFETSVWYRKDPELIFGKLEYRQLHKNEDLAIEFHKKQVVKLKQRVKKQQIK